MARRSKTQYIRIPAGITRLELTFMDQEPYRLNLKAAEGLKISQNHVSILFGDRQLAIIGKPVVDRNTSGDILEISVQEGPDRRSAKRVQRASARSAQASSKRGSAQRTQGFPGKALGGGIAATSVPIKASYGVDPRFLKAQPMGSKQ